MLNHKNLDGLTPLHLLIALNKNSTSIENFLRILKKITKEEFQKILITKSNRIQSNCFTIAAGCNTSESIEVISKLVIETFEGEQNETDKIKSHLILQIDEFGRTPLDSATFSENFLKLLKLANSIVSKAEFNKYLLSSDRDNANIFYRITFKCNCAIEEVMDIMKKY